MILAPLSSSTATLLEQHHPVWRDAFAWIRALPSAPPDGITELRGRDLYVNVHGYETLPEEKCRWESHRQTIDVQYCITGGEIIDWLPAGALLPRGDYAEAKDTEFWHPSTVQPTRLVMTPGLFALFLPGELHRPKGRDGTNTAVHKLVVKIKSLLVLDHVES